MSTVEETFKFARDMDIHTCATIRMISKCARSSQGAALEHQDGCIELTDSEASALVASGVIKPVVVVKPYVEPYEPHRDGAASAYSLTSYGLSVIGALKILRKL
jgi:hypothetical protein